MKNFNQDVERLKLILEILKLKNLRQKDLGQKDLERYRKLAYHTVEKVADLFLKHNDREAEKILAKALGCSDKRIKFSALHVLLKAQRAGRRLYKRTSARLKKLEEEK